MRLSPTVRWIGLALLGLAISAAVAVAASNLVSREIGITSESVSAGDALAPAVESAARTESNPPDVEGRAGAEGGGGGEVEGGGGSETADEFEERLDAREDAREDREKAREDALDEREDAREDREDD